ncbi:MAG: type I 3-dehydroquinate dehydratase [Desulfobacterales bacterium]|nr:type I 3-dehydroquinate dehydratase [Desulfobacterales bacterium]
MEMTKTAKMKLLKQAVVLGADFIDIELAAGERAISQLQSFRRKQKSLTRIIVSWHDTSKTPSLAKLKEIFLACVKTGADLVKIVPYARKMSDNLKVLSLIAYAQAQNRDIIAMCMGD